MIGTKEAAKKLNEISERRLRVLCADGRVPGAKLIGKTWMLPDDPVVLAKGRTRPSKIEMTEPKKKRKKKGE